MLINKNNQHPFKINIKNSFCLNYYPISAWFEPSEGECIISSFGPPKPPKIPSFPGEPPKPVYILSLPLNPPPLPPPSPNLPSPIQTSSSTPNPRFPHPLPPPPPPPPPTPPSHLLHIHHTTTPFTHPSPH